MQEIVYVDVLIVLNLFISYFLLLSASFALKEYTKRLRLFAGALLGGLYSLVVFLPEMGTMLNFVSRIIAGAAMVLVAFGFKSYRRFLKLFAVFVLMTFTFAGLMIGMWIIFRPDGMLINNSAVYFQVSMPLLIASTAVCYFVSKAVIKLLNKNKPQKTISNVKLEMSGQTLEGKAMLDTGNTLSESFSGYPVVICTYDFLRKVIPEDAEDFFRGDVNALGEVTDENWKKKLRVVSFLTVGDTGLLPAFQPDRLIVDNSYETDKVFVGVMSRKKYINESFDMLLNPNLF